MERWQEKLEGKGFDETNIELLLMPREVPGQPHWRWMQVEEASLGILTQTPAGAFVELCQCPVILIWVDK